ncbi:class I SAM-dependent methyltransferase [Methanobrevibacter sp. DSM 116169]|uniref:class I SAM-dependent methyltransferase n=1 Tax=Methanobrevibacter sp. DSM 116169 TaxID=3242727 RepID=UPI0038FC9BF0
MNSLEDSISNSLDSQNSDILPFISYLLQDFWQIGTPFDDIYKLIKNNIKDPSNIKVLDLGCGKGAISIQLAQKFNCKCHGIDGLEDFIEFSKMKSKKLKVDHLTTFTTGDIREEIKKLPKFDLIILGATGPIFENYLIAISKLSSILNENGFIIISDAYSNDNFKYISKNELFNQVNKADFKVIDEIMDNNEIFIEDFNKEYALIEKRSLELINKYPDKKDLFIDFLNGQKEEYDDLKDLTGITFIIARN